MSCSLCFISQCTTLVTKSFSLFLKIIPFNQPESNSQPSPAMLLGAIYRVTIVRYSYFKPRSTVNGIGSSYLTNRLTTPLKACSQARLGGCGSKVALVFCNKWSTVSRKFPQPVGPFLPHCTNAKLNLPELPFFSAPVCWVCENQNGCIDIGKICKTLGTNLCPDQSDVCKDPILY